MAMYGETDNREMYLLTRDGRKLKDQELAQAVADARAHGLLVAADAHQVNPKELFAFAQGPA
jgi:hypothetical protein